MDNQATNSPAPATRRGAMEDNVLNPVAEHERVGGWF